jgi:DNA-directed RNA polymerase specialized sigma24 family protein
MPSPTSTGSRTEQLEAFYRAHAARAYRLASRYSNQRAVDVTARVLVRLREQLSLLDDPEVVSWLEEQIASEAVDVADAPTPSLDAETTSTKSLTRRTLSELTTAQRVAVCLTALDGRSEADLAECLGLSFEDAQTLLQGVALTRAEFEAGLRAIDDAFPKDLPAAVDATLRKALARRPLRPWAALATVGLLAALGTAIFFSVHHPSVAGFRSLAPFGVRYDNPDESSVRVVSGQADLSDETMVGVHVAVKQGTWFKRTPSGVHLLAGTARFDIGHHPSSAPPFSIEVSGGTLEVVRGFLDVTQGSDGGEVRLLTGQVHFRASDGREVDLANSDDRLSWPLAAPP